MTLGRLDPRSPPPPLHQANKGREEAGVAEDRLCPGFLQGKNNFTIQEAFVNLLLATKKGTGKLFSCILQICLQFFTYNLKSMVLLNVWGR
jgi:hypothetical protein